MIALLLYRSDEICPFAFHLCDDFKEDDNILTIRKDDTDIVATDYDYYIGYSSNSPEEEQQFVDLMCHVAKTLRGIP